MDKFNYFLLCRLDHTIRFSLANFFMKIVHFQIPKYLKPDMYEILPEFRNFPDLGGHSRGNPRSGLIFMGGGGCRGFVRNINCVYFAT